jgi:cell division protein FtsL
MNIQELVLSIRLACDISQHTLSVWTKIDQGSLSLYEAGKRNATLRRKKKLIEIANKKCGLKLKYSDIVNIEL